MAQELTVRQKQELQLREHATGLIATLSDAEKARDFERGLTVKKIVDNALPIREMSRVTSTKAVAQTIDIALTKFVKSVNVGNNLSDYQIKEIVEDLMDKYPNESIEDFMLVFKKARTGEFGTIYNLHSAVIFEWMTKYLDEKYQVLEDKLMKEGDDQNKVPEYGPGYAEFLKWNEQLQKEVKKVPDMDKADIDKFGQKKPVRNSVTAGYKYFDVRGVQIYAITQEHAEELAEKLLKDGIIEEYTPE